MSDCEGDAFQPRHGQQVCVQRYNQRNEAYESNKQSSWISLDLLTDLIKQMNYDGWMNNFVIVHYTMKLCTVLFLCIKH